MPFPPEDIFPHATGNAQATINEHTSPQEVVLYAGWFCPFAQRAWLTLEIKQIPYQYKEVNPYLREPDYSKLNPPEFRQINPRGLIPAISYRGKPLSESLIVSEFLDDAYPNSVSLLPKDPYDRSRIKLAIHNIENAFIPAWMRLWYARDAESQEKARGEIVQSLDKFTKEMKGPFFTGNEVSLADIALIPFVVRLFLIEKYRQFDTKKLGPKFGTWMNTVLDLDFVQRTTSELDKYGPMYNQFLK